MGQPLLPLDDLRILDLTHYYQGPYATFLLSHLGAEVIKVEAPGFGEGGRALFRRKGKPYGTPFAMLNSNKQSITLNLKSPEGNALFKRLVRKADIVVENYAAGTMDSMGLGYEVLRAENPRLIYATATGFGLSGPYRDIAAFDPIIQAMGGLMAITGEADGPPMKTGAAVADFLGGTHLCAGLLAAIRQRDRTGTGLMVELCLYDSLIPTLTSFLGAMNMGLTNLRDGNRASGGAIAPYNAYPASDGWVMILAGDNVRWKKMCDLMGKPELASDERFASAGARARNLAEVDLIVEQWTRTKTRRELFDMMAAADVFCGIVQDLPEVMADEHLLARGMLREVDHPALGPMTIFTSPVRLDGEQPVPTSTSPALGEDNDHVYRDELGLSVDEIAALRDRKVI
jgi:crotonobetainyl-CoA:carnitine CoA-transferase CaiB-like acyl-CoA transferase